MPDPVTSRRKLPEMDWSDPEQVREYQRLYQERNRERIVQQKHAYYLRNRDKSLRERREYVQRNRETIKARKADYYQRNKDAIKQRAAAYRAQNPGKNRETLLRSHHGMRPEDWDALWAAQDGRCYLCGGELNPGPGRNVHIEHDHACCPLFRSCSICRRGLACKRCNSAIGLAGDDPARLRRMADALEAAQLAVEQRKAAASMQLDLLEGFEDAAR